jgi:hypothetical protein
MSDSSEEQGGKSDSDENHENDLGYDFYFGKTVKTLSDHRSRKLSKSESENNLSQQRNNENEASTSSPFRRKNFSERLQRNINSSSKKGDLYNFLNTQLVIQDNNNNVKDQQTPIVDSNNVGKKEEPIIGGSKTDEPKYFKNSSTHKTSHNSHKLKRFKSENNLYIKNMSVSYSQNATEVNKAEQKTRSCGLETDNQFLDRSLDDKKKVK